MKRTCAVLVCVLGALAACADAGWQTRTVDGGAYQFKPGSFDLEQMKAATLAEPGAQSTLRDDRIEVMVPGKEQVYLFTRETNAAHPSLIILTLHPQVTPLKAYSGAPIASFDKWLLSIGQDRDQIVATYLRRP